MAPTRACVALKATLKHGEQKELAAEIGENATHLSKVINGRRPPSFILVGKIRNARGIPADWWFEPASWADIDAKEAA